MFITKTAVAVVAGLAMAGAILVAPGVIAAPTAGRAAAWGSNIFGQLGDNSYTDSKVPVAVNTAGVLAGKTITTITAGDTHTCVVAEGRAYCWGNNSNGQLGDNTTTTSKVPVAVNGVLAGKTVTAITAGTRHSCAVADGKAYCWGYNSNGQLGNNTTADSSAPIAVNTTGVLAGRTVSAITAGGVHTCAVADGDAYCWGNNDFGQLGNNNAPTSASVPVAVEADSGPLDGKTITGITAGYYHSCAVADGNASCWGYNVFGQLGNNSSISYSAVPVAVHTAGVLAGRTVTSITAGYYHSCAVADGNASCWGNNTFGQLGDNNAPTNAKVPVAVNGVLAGRTVSAITAGYFHTCAVAEGGAFCWGNNGNGQLGDNNAPTNATVPVAVNTAGLLAGKTVTALTAGGYHSAVLAAAPPQPPTAVTGAPGNAQVSVSWTAPTDDGGSPVLEYVTTASPGGASCTTTGSSCVVSGLTNGTGYTFTVTARNAIGTSTPSTPSAPVTPTDPPVQPPVLQQQTASVKVPKKIKYKGKTVLLKKKVKTNAGQKAKSKVTVKPKAKKYSKVKTTKAGKVTIKTLGKKKLKVTLKLTAPATSQYKAYTYTKKWTVKKKRS